MAESFDSDDDVGSEDVNGDQASGWSDSDSDDEPRAPIKSKKIKKEPARGRKNLKEESDEDEHENVPAEEEFAYSRPSMSHVKNKERRAKLNQQTKELKTKLKKEAREKRKRLEEKLGDEAPARKKQKTLDNTREFDHTIVEAGDEEVADDEDNDEFAEYFRGNTTPKIMITTSYSVHRDTLLFVEDLLDTIPDSHFYSRRQYHIKEIVGYANNNQFTDILVINENNLVANAMLHIHLPYGPTALYKLTSVQLRKDIKNHGAPTSHKPEMILNNFSTRLGHTIGRMFACIFPQQPQFEGRRVVTFHNQRDYIFFRHHRYIFDDNKTARLQELGPRFTMKLQSLQRGTFDSQFGEYIWLPKKEHKPSRRRFFL
eukprot:TRINITY_DN5734_c0_g1_i1.p1 TRINITY_DN5734_c0_g1~~TRINITY_DN5734_c0_g1_i1.p1  ORF type:complete len:381 (+),score=96.45 TRINITY_DN5734_c0_g1_i1:28-1143(+)